MMSEPKIRTEEGYFLKDKVGIVAGDSSYEIIIPATFELSNAFVGEVILVIVGSRLATESNDDPSSLYSQLVRWGRMNEDKIRAFLSHVKANATLPPEAPMH